MDSSLISSHAKSKNDKLAVLLLAGGRGTRFWPLSRQSRPKQFLKLAGERSLIQSAWDLALKVTTAETIFVSTGLDLVEQVHQHLPALPRSHLFAEPVGRNTAPCLVWCTELIHRMKGPGTRLLVLPSDHWVEDALAFQKDVRALLSSLETSPERMGVFGIKPTRPHTGYGYIERGDDISESGVCQVSRFVEKPSEEKAQEYVASKRFFWNAGMFLWDVRTFLEASSHSLPGACAFLDATRNSVLSHQTQTVSTELFSLMEATSVDYGVMERAKDLILKEATFRWTDLGSYLSLYELLSPDHGDVVTLGAQIKTEECRNSLVINRTKRPLCAFGLQSQVLVQEEDVTFLGPLAVGSELKALSAPLSKRYL